MKTLRLLFIIAIAFSCQQKPNISNPAIKKGMIKVAIMYPNAEDKTFDMDYYAQNHMPLAITLFDTSLKAMVIDKGLAGGTAELPPTYLAIGYFYFETMASFQSSMGEHSEQLRADVPNFTNIKPVIQVSKVQTAR